MFLLLILYIPKLNISTFKLCYKHHSNFSDMEMTIWLDFITKELTEASANVMTSVLLLLRQDFYHLLHHSHGNYAILIEREKQTTAILPASWPTCDLNEADPMAAFAVRPFVASSFVSDLWLYPRQSSRPSSSKVFPAEMLHTSETTVLYHPTLEGAKTNTELPLLCVRRQDYILGRDVFMSASSVLALFVL